MPISPFDVPAQSSANAIDANRRGILFRSQGRLAEAIAAFREGIASEPQRSELHVNLASALADMGESEAALASYEAAIRLNPLFADAFVGLGALLVRLGRFDDARSAYEQALRLDGDEIRANLAMYELEQIARDVPKALQHQSRVLRRQSLFSEYAPREQRRILVLLAPGDWQANVPIDFLVDRETTTLHKLYVLSPAQLAQSVIPSADVVFNAIAESDANDTHLQLAETLMAGIGLPVLNKPASVLRTNRVRFAQLLSGLPHAIVPQTLRQTRAQILTGDAGIAFPIVVRPVGSHAGHDLERIENAAQLQAYCNRIEADEFFVMPFVDFSCDDGFYRKYRIIIVNGVPYAYHLAISPRWMIHYYNAPMAEHAWMREEERRFLEHFEEVVALELRTAMSEVARILDLEYFGIDCSIDRQGRLLIFEADPAMIVHAGDDPQMFGYKIPAAKRVFAAFERLVDRARSR